MTSALITALILAASTAAIRFVYRAQYQDRHRDRRRALVALHFAAVSAIIVSYWWECWKTHQPGISPPVLAVAGWIVFALGSVLFWWSAVVHVTSLVPDESAGLTVVGPYRVLRHPIYTGGLLGALGLLLVVPAPGVAADWLVLLGCMVLLARSEERELVERLPGYREYLARTGGLVPMLWSRR